MRRRFALVLPLCALFVAFMAGASGNSVAPRAEEAEPLAVGAQVPSVFVETVKGERVDLATLSRDSGALLVFYRGGW